MKTIILATILMTTVSAQTAKACGSRPGTLRLLAMSANEIKTESKNEYRVEIDRKNDAQKDLTQLGNSIGLVSSANNEPLGTGFLVDACHVLTNNHVAFPHGTKASKNYPINFSLVKADLNTKETSNISVSGTVVDFGNFEESYSSAKSDWVVIKLSKPVGNDVGYIPFHQMDAQSMENRNVITLGYAGEKTNYGKDISKIYGDLNCKILGTNVYGYSMHNCQTSHGQSGSPIMAKAKDGKYYAIAMVSGDKSFSSATHTTELEKSNIAVSFLSAKSVKSVSEGDKIAAALKQSCD